MLNRLRFIGAFVFIFLLTNISSAQTRDTTVRRTNITSDSLTAEITIVNDTTIALDSLDADTVAADSTNKTDLAARLGIVISGDALEAVVTSEARDSAVLDMSQNIFYLYGTAKVNYQDLQLEAGEIIYNQGGNMVTAAPSFDSIGISKTKPTFTQGAEKFTYDSLQYNFKSKRAIVRNVRTQYGEGYVFSEQIKRNPDQSIYGLHSIYTTCALDTPHFGIYAKKIKVIPNRVAATGPANIAIEQVPTPLFLPFGLFPVTQGQRSGFRLPTYTVEEQRGLGLINGGYYFNLSQYADLLMQTNIYSKGSYGVSGVSTYTNRYKYAGGLSFSYAYNKVGENYEPNASISKDFLLNWQHHSDAKSRPGVRFDASVNAGTSSFYALNTYTVNQILTNQYNSNITYSKSWQNKPISLSVGARHSQNTLSGLVEVTLPEVNFYVAQFNPFQSKNSTGTHWYDKITTQYQFNAINRISFYDSLFSFARLGITDFQNGMVHTIPINATYNVLRFINVGINATYKEYWLTQKTYQAYNPALDKVDSTMYRGFYTARDFTSGLTANTRIYGVKMFRKGKLMGIRHVLSPNASLSFAPDYGTDPFNYGYRTYINKNSNTYEYRSVFDGSVVGTPGNQYGNFSSLLGFGIDNNLQIKV
ncbi:MAG: LPS-assembly protein LptD, partial [Sphingobacteriales bacterium]